MNFFYFVTHAVNIFKFCYVYVNYTIINPPNQFELTIQFKLPSKIIQSQTKEDTSIRNYLKF